MRFPRIPLRATSAGLGVALTIATPLVMLHEGIILKSYPDPVQIWTACYGHTGPDVKPGQVYSPEKCLELLEQDLAIAQKAVRRNVLVPIHPKTEAALISFVYNVGEGNLQRSTLLKKINRFDIAGACHELPKWIYAKGKKLKGLVKRREAEKALCLEGAYAN